MKTLTIQDLSVTEQLDSKAMRAVRGGTFKYPTSNFVNIMPISFDASKTVKASQYIGTQLGIQSANGNDSAFLDHVTTKINPDVDAHNNVNVY